jgi:hypothetical protein
MTALQRWPLLLLIYSNESVILGASKDPGPEGPALVHPGFRLVEPKSLQLGERGDIADYLYQQYSGVRCQVSATEVELGRSRS